MALEASRPEGVPAGGCCLGALPTQAHVLLLESDLRAFQVKRKLFHGFFFFFGGGVGMGIHTLINPLRSSLGGGEKGQNWFLRAVGWAEPGACPMAPDGSDVCSCLGSPV